MRMLKAGILLTTLTIGGVAAFLGTFVMLSALTSGIVRTSFATARGVPSETVSFAADPGYFALLLLCLGAAPIVLGIIALQWAWRQLKEDFRKPHDR
jgi:hypothetical protein